MRKKAVGTTWRVLAFTVVVALLLGAGALLAAHVGAGAAEEREAERLETMVEQINASSASNYNAIADFLNRQGSGDDGRFWMLASDGTILYLKDAATSEAYRGASVGAYVRGSNLQGLLEAAEGGGSSHGTISVDGEEHLVNATSFTRGGNVYDLALFTAAPVLGDDWLSQHSLLVAILAIALVLLVAVPTLIAAYLEAARRKSLSRAPVPAASALPGEAPACAGDREGLLPDDQDDGGGPADNVGPMSDGDDPAGDGCQVEPDAPMLLLRPESELRGHLSEFLESGVGGGCLVRIACKDGEAMERVRRRLGALAGDAKTNCFHWGENSFVLELFEVDERTIYNISVYFLQDDAEVVACVPID